MNIFTGSILSNTCYRVVCLPREWCSVFREVLRQGFFIFISMLLHQRHIFIPMMFSKKYQMLTLFARNANIYNDEDAIATIPFFFVNYCVVHCNVIDVLRSYFCHLYWLHICVNDLCSLFTFHRFAKKNTSSTLHTCPVIYWSPCLRLYKSPT